MPKSAITEAKSLQEVIGPGVPIPEELKNPEAAVPESKLKALENTATIIQLPNNINVMRLPEIPGRTYFDFLRESQKSADDGIRFMMSACFIRVDTRQPLTISEIEDEGGITFQGVATLADEIISLFPEAQVKLRSSQLLKSATHR